MALDQGSITVEREHGRASVGYVPQKFALDPYMPMRARDLVALGLDGNRLGVPFPSRRRRARVDEMLAAVDATRFADQRIGDLSGGQQQRVLIAHALIRGRACCCWTSRSPTWTCAAWPGSSACCGGCRASCAPRCCSRRTT